MTNTWIVLIRGNLYVKLWVNKVKQVTNTSPAECKVPEDWAISFWIYGAKLHSWNSVAQVLVEWMHRCLFCLSWVLDLLPAMTLVRLHFVSSSHSSPAFPNSILPQPQINASPLQSWRPTSDLCSTEVSRPRVTHSCSSIDTQPDVCIHQQAGGKKKKE